MVNANCVLFHTRIKGKNSYEDQPDAFPHCPAFVNVIALACGADQNDFLTTLTICLHTFQRCLGRGSIKFGWFWFTSVDLPKSNPDLLSSNFQKKASNPLQLGFPFSQPTSPPYRLWTINNGCCSKSRANDTHKFKKLISIRWSTFCISSESAPRCFRLQ